MEMRRAAQAGRSGSLLLHGAILLALIAASQLRVDALGDPSIRSPRMNGIILPPGAAAAGPPKSAKKPEPPREAREPEPAQEKPEEPQPQIVPEEIPRAEDPVSSSEAGIENGIEGGAEGGVKGGIAGGDPNGVVGGVPDGVAGAPIGGLGPVPAGEPAEEPLRIIGEVSPPERTAFVKPEYPETARLARRQGKVILEIVVGRTGEVEEVVVLRSDPLFDRAATEAVRKWKYRPALQGGRPVKVYMTVIVSFTLD